MDGRIIPVMVNPHNLINYHRPLKQPARKIIIDAAKVAVLMVPLLLRFNSINDRFIAFHVFRPLPDGRGTAFMPYLKRKRGVKFI
jgi:hypothetical protein